MTHVLNKRQEKHTVKGFTLMEMILVIGLITILIAMFVPMVSSYLTRSRLNSANSTARIIFNSAQTVCQEYEFFDRNGTHSEFYGTVDGEHSKMTDSTNPPSLFFHVEDGQLVSGSVSVKHAGSVQTGGATTSLVGLTDDDVAGVLTAASGNRLAPLTGNPDGTPSCFMNRMSLLVEDFSDWSWDIYIKEYQVQGVVCASGAKSEYIGCFPGKASDKNWGGYANVQAVTDETMLLAIIGL